MSNFAFCSFFGGGRRAVERLHGGVHSLKDQGKGGFRGPLDPFIGIGIHRVQHKILQVLLPFLGSAHADLHPGELIGGQLVDDVFDAVVSPGGAGGPHPGLPQPLRRTRSRPEGRLMSS